MNSESSQQYEFNASQNELIKSLASTMNFVGYFLIVIGAFATIAGIIQITSGGITALIQGVVQVLIGFWTTKAAKSFQLIVDTEGRDIENLMGALGELRKLYGLQYWILIIALIFVGVSLISAIILSFFGS
jgi:hypothetical protein